MIVRFLIPVTIFKRRANCVQWIAAIVWCLSLSLNAPSANAADLQRTGEFTAKWTAVGTAQTLVLDESSSASILRLQGIIITESSQGLTRFLQTDCVGLNLQDETIKGTGRCVWVDTDGDRAISEITAALSGIVSEVRGHFVGGTGKYDNLEGEFELGWKYLEPIEEEGTINGYSTNMVGSWKLP